jgi:osmotically-inducible protein OsmY
MGETDTRDACHRVPISVGTTDGTVTLAGTAPSPDMIGNAMLSALETERVREVVSTLQVR